MTGLTHTVFEAADRLTDPERWHPRVRSDAEIVAEFPEPKRAERLIHERKGQKFRPHGTDSVGVIVSHPKSRRTVQFFYRHDPGTLHSMQAYEFTTRFARLFDVRNRRPRPQASPNVRHVRATPAGAIQTMKEAA